jgi:hypothetical protein
MPIELILIVGYAVVILSIIVRAEKSPKKRPRITGRGGDFE